MTYRASAAAASHGATAAATSTTITVPATVQAGDVLSVLVATNDSTAAFTCTGGGTGVTWTSRHGPDTASAALSSQVFTATATASSAGSTITVGYPVSGRLTAVLQVEHQVVEAGVVVARQLSAADATKEFPAVDVTQAGSDLVGLMATRPATLQVAETYSATGVTVDATCQRADASGPLFQAVALHQAATVGTGARSIPTLAVASGRNVLANTYTLAFAPTPPSTLNRLRIGDPSVNAVRIGDSTVSRVYAGDTQLWP